MTDQEKESQLGQVMFAIKKHEGEMRPLLVKAQQIGIQLRTLATSLEENPFGVVYANDKYTGANTSGAHLADRFQEALDAAALIKLEDDVRSHGRELARLYSQRSQLGF